ncbi:MAG: chemotaxis protein CheB [Frankiales bacterium]|nr:chemotaxis protein CheB [Frankiales bacterium]
MQLVAGLPPDLDAPVLVVLHLPATVRSRLSDVLGRRSALPVAWAESGQPLLPSQVLLAPPDQHLLVHDGAVLLARGPKENGHRPAVDALFRSAARWLGPRAVAVVLTGALDDGAAGAAAVVAQGGTVLVQDPQEALFDGMPRSALAAAPGALVLPAAGVGPALPALLARTLAEADVPVSPDLVLETDMAQMDDGAVSGLESPGEPAHVSCPECHGAMTEVHTGSARHYRCHVGHAYGPASLLEAQDRTVEASLWSAVSSLEEQAGVLRSLAEVVDEATAARHQDAADDASRQATDLRRLLRSRSHRSAGGAA